MKHLMEKVVAYLKQKLGEGQAMIRQLSKRPPQMFEQPVKEPLAKREPGVALNFAITPPPLNAGELARRKQNGDF